MLRFNLTLRTSSSAFAEERIGPEMANVLRKIATLIEAGSTEEQVMAIITKNRRIKDSSGYFASSMSACHGHWNSTVSAPPLAP